MARRLHLAVSLSTAVIQNARRALALAYPEASQRDLGATVVGFARHEGNYAMYNILNGARASEQ